MKDKGFILLAMLFMMVLMAVTAVALNRRAAMQARMATNQSQAIQTSVGQMATVEQAIWELTRDPYWRTGSSVYTYDGTDYNLAVSDSAVSGYIDAITVSVTAPGAASGVTTAFRYFLADFPDLAKPNQICRDNFDNIYIADEDNHTILKVDGSTGAMTIVAGNGNGGGYDPNDEGKRATEVPLNKPRGVAVDAFGAIYIADTDHHRIRKVDLAGNITTVAGTGTGGYDAGEDGGPATDAKLKKPNGVFVDGDRNIYIADTDNHCIRKVDTSGIITTVAGTGSPGESGNGGPATSAKLDKPRGVFVDNSGNIYIADANNCWIRKVDATPPYNITIIAGKTGAGRCSYSGDGGLATDAKLDKPRGVFWDTSGNIYIADSDNNRIRKVDASGIITTVAGNGSEAYSGDGGPAINAQIAKPRGVTLKSTGEIFIADTNNSILREVDLGDIISTVTGTATPGLDSPSHIAMDSSGNVYIADRDNNQIRKLDPSGGVTTIAGTGTLGFSGDGGPATSAELNIPNSVAMDSSGNIYIADTNNHRIRKVYTSGVSEGEIYTVAGTGTGGYNGDNILAITAELKNPKGVHVDSSGNIYIADTGNQRIRKVYASGPNEGKIYTVAGKGPPGGYDTDDKPATSAKINNPQGIFVDTSGDIYFADTDNHIIRKVAESNQYIYTVAGTPEIAGFIGDGGPATSALLRKPNGVFLDSGGNMFVADKENHVIRVVSTHDDKIYTLAGTGSGGFNGDDQPAVEAQLRKPAGVAMATTRGGRKIYISDTGNNRIRVLTFKIERRLY